jgi:hypothetical protein
MASNIKEEIFHELAGISQYIYEPKTKVVEIQKRLDVTLNILNKILDEIQRLYRVIESDETVITQDDLPDIVGRFNDTIDTIILAYNKWFKMSEEINNSIYELYDLNTDMQEIRINISTLINNIVGGYSV